MYIYIYNTLHESEYDMAKYCISRLIYFHSQRKVKIKSEGEIVCYITMSECNKWFILH